MTNQPTRSRQSGKKKQTSVAAPLSFEEAAKRLETERVLRRQLARGLRSESGVALPQY